MFPHAGELHLHHNHHNHCAGRLIHISLIGLRFPSGMVLPIHSGQIAIALTILAIITAVLRALIHTVLGSGSLNLIGIVETLGDPRH